MIFCYFISEGCKSEFDSSDLLSVVVQKRTARSSRDSSSDSYANREKYLSTEHTFAASLAHVAASRTLKLYISYFFTSWVGRLVNYSTQFPPSKYVKRTTNLFSITGCPTVVVCAVARSGHDRLRSTADGHQRLRKYGGGYRVRQCRWPLDRSNAAIER
jgi:hypothetical protein